MINLKSNIKFKSTSTESLMLMAADADKTQLFFLCCFVLVAVYGVGVGGQSGEVSGYSSIS